MTSTFMTVESIGKMVVWQKAVPKTRVHEIARMRRTTYEGMLADRAVVIPLNDHFTAHCNSLESIGPDQVGCRRVYV